MVSTVRGISIINMIELLSLEFMQRALLAGVALAPLLAILGSFATLRNMSFFADGIAHASLLGVAIALITGAVPFAGALVIGLLLGILIFVIERYTQIKSDAVIGIIFTTGLALGIILISSLPGYQPELISFLFGSILSVTWSDVTLIFISAIVILGIVTRFFRDFTLLSLSRDLAFTSGVNTNQTDLLFYVILSVSIVLGVKLLGIILVSSLLITPAVTSRLVTRSFSSYFQLSQIISLAAFFLGLIASYYLDLPSGASIVVCAAIIFAAVFLLKRLGLVGNS